MVDVAPPPQLPSVAPPLLTIAQHTVPAPLHSDASLRAVPTTTRILERPGSLQLSQVHVLIVFPLPSKRPNGQKATQRRSRSNYMPVGLGQSIARSGSCHQRTDPGRLGYRRPKLPVLRTARLVQSGVLHLLCADLRLLLPRPERTAATHSTRSLRSVARHCRARPPRCAMARRPWTAQPLTITKRLPAARAHAQRIFPPIPVTDVRDTTSATV